MQSRVCKHDMNVDAKLSGGTKERVCWEETGGKKRWESAVVSVRTALPGLPIWMLRHWGVELLQTN